MEGNQFLTVRAELVPEKIFASRDNLVMVLDKVAEIVKNHVAEVETPAGRKETASFSNQVARTKTLIDEAGKDSVAELKAEVKRVDGLRKLSRDFLDGQKIIARAPLTEYEENEKKRIAEEERLDRIEVQLRIDRFAELGVILPYAEVFAMTDEEYDTAVFDAEEDFKAKQADLEEQRFAREAEAAEVEKERERQKEERERQERIQAGLDAKAAELQAKQDEIEAKEKAMAEAKEAEERAKEEAERVIREAKEKLEREEEQRLTREKEEAERAARAEKLKPDKKKLDEWLEDCIGAIPKMPEFDNELITEISHNAVQEAVGVFTRAMSLGRGL